MTNDSILCIEKFYPNDDHAGDTYQGCSLVEMRCGCSRGMLTLQGEGKGRSHPQLRSLHESEGRSQL